MKVAGDLLIATTDICSGSCPVHTESRAAKDFLRTISRSPRTGGFFNFRNKRPVGASSKAQEKYQQKLLTSFDKLPPSARLCAEEMVALKSKVLTEQAKRDKQACLDRNLAMFDGLE